MKRLATILTLLCLMTANAFSQGKQFLYIELSPANATLEINGEVKETLNGVYQELLPLGNYSYRASKEGYSEINGIISISDPFNTHELKLNLKRQVGYLSIPTDFIIGSNICAEVYIDDKPIGVTPISDMEIASGSHQLTIKHPLYKDYNITFQISDEENLTLTPKLVKNYVNVILTADEDTDIYVNDEYLATGSWSGIMLLETTYILEGRKTSHRSNPISYTISPKDDACIIQIPEPTPIYGSLAITSSIGKAELYIDNVYIGETPKYIPKILVGKHHIHILGGEEAIVEIKEGQEEKIILSNIPGTILSDQIDIVDDEIEIEDIIIEADNLHDFKFKIMDYPIDYQIEVVEEVVEEEAIPFQLVEEKPSFKGGDANLFSKWVNQRLVYPEIAKENGVQGRVTLQFIVEKDGSITHVKVLRGVDPSLDKEAVRVVSSSPKWIPGRQRNRAVSVTYTFPVIFQLR